MNKFRQRLLEKLAQDADPNSITTPVPSVSGSPPSFSIQSLFPSIYTGFGQTITNQIASLSSYLNSVLYYTSNGKYDMLKIFNNSASIDTSGIVDQDLKKLVDFSKLVFRYLFNNKAAFTRQLTAQEITDRIDILSSNPQLISLSNTNPAGQLATKVKGNVKTNIIAYLQYIKNSIPSGVAQPTR